MSNESFIKLVTILEARWTHPGRRPDTFHCLVRLGNHEWAELATQEARVMEGFQFFALADIEPLADINKGWHGGVIRAQCARDDSANVGCGHRLGGRVTGMPLGLMPGMENEA